MKSPIQQTSKSSREYVTVVVAISSMLNMLLLSCAFLGTFAKIAWAMVVGYLLASLIGAAVVAGSAYALKFSKWVAIMITTTSWHLAVFGTLALEELLSLRTASSTQEQLLYISGRSSLTMLLTVVVALGMLTAVGWARRFSNNS